MAIEMVSIDIKFTSERSSTVMYSGLILYEKTFKKLPQISGCCGVHDDFGMENSFVNHHRTTKST